MPVTLGSIGNNVNVLQDNMIAMPDQKKSVNPLLDLPQKKEKQSKDSGDLFIDLGYPFSQLDNPSKVASNDPSSTQSSNTVTANNPTSQTNAVSTVSALDPAGQMSLTTFIAFLSSILNKSLYIDLDNKRNSLQQEKQAKSSEIAQTTQENIDKIKKRAQDQINRTKGHAKCNLVSDIITAVTIVGSAIAVAATAGTAAPAAVGLMVGVLGGGLTTEAVKAGLDGQAWHDTIKAENDPNDPKYLRRANKLLKASGKVGVAVSIICAVVAVGSIGTALCGVGMAVEETTEDTAEEVGKEVEKKVENKIEDEIEDKMENKIEEEVTDKVNNENDEQENKIEEKKKNIKNAKKRLKRVRLMTTVDGFGFKITEELNKADQDFISAHDQKGINDDQNLIDAINQLMTITENDITTTENELSSDTDMMSTDNNLIANLNSDVKKINAASANNI